ncbi:MAG: hypothetical protein JWL85_803 [Candidatus Saccharibacteria bacterium]|nr:hypothetical protein [Candidatus Saccharibacteria bacterium]
MPLNVGERGEAWAEPIDSRTMRQTELALLGDDVRSLGRIMLVGLHLCNSVSIQGGRKVNRANAADVAIEIIAPYLPPYPETDSSIS